MPEPDPRAYAMGLLVTPAYRQLCEVDSGEENGMLRACRQASCLGVVRPGDVSELPGGSPRCEQTLMGRVIAYITTNYRGLSHTFILREVEALRRRGVDISTTGVHRATPDGLLSEDNRRAFETTHAMLPVRWTRVARTHLHALARHPRAPLSTLRLSLELSRPAWRGRLWQVFYFGGPVTAWDHWRKLGIRYVHAHFAAVPSDVALLASHLGRCTVRALRAGASPGRADELADALGLLLRDPGLRKRMAVAARRDVASRYDVDAPAAELSELFAKLLGEPLEAPALIGGADDAGRGRESIAAAPVELGASR